MAIVQTVNLYQFREAFRSYKRENFSYEGLEVLFNYLEEYSDSTGEPVELDVIALCCDYEESSIEEIISYHSIDVSDAEGDEEEVECIVEGYLQDNTSVCGKVEGGFVYASF